MHLAGPVWWVKLIAVPKAILPANIRRNFINDWARVRRTVPFAIPASMNFEALTKTKPLPPNSSAALMLFLLTNCWSLARDSTYPTPQLLSRCSLCTFVMNLPWIFILEILFWTSYLNAVVSLWWLSYFWKLFTSVQLTFLIFSSFIYHYVGNVLLVKTSECLIGENTTY